ncbi:MAG: NUDIX hydrolase, partial [Candidatus Eremiobacteraeota bacterium]|nr:NUDIX hydrolase [Candidatus Eremiobacteraeota bacterium]
SESPLTNLDARALVNAAVREMREEASIDLSDAELHLFSHWITPPTEPRRYNTHFFLARATSEHVGSADRFETHDERWIAPTEALALHAIQKLRLMYPTIKHLERIGAFHSVDDIWAFTKTKPIVTIMPGTAPEEGFVMPPQLEGIW